MDAELSSFISFCHAAAGKSGGLTTACQSSSEARRLRRRFYHLRERLTGHDAVVAGKLSAKVTGRILWITPTSQSPVDWDSLATGESNETTVPASNRLNDESLVR